MKITILHNRTCNIWQTTKQIIKELLKEKDASLHIEEILITNNEEAKKYNFSGSPQVLINGKDIDPEAHRVTNYHESGCRFYIWKDKVYEGPTREMLAEVILGAKQ